MGRVTRSYPAVIDESETSDFAILEVKMLSLRARQSLTAVPGKPGTFAHPKHGKLVYLDNPDRVDGFEHLEPVYWAGKYLAHNPAAFKLLNGIEENITWHGSKLSQYLKECKGLIKSLSPCQEPSHPFCLQNDAWFTTMDANDKG
jgi:hypothetical protein